MNNNNLFSNQSNNLFGNQQNKQKKSSNSNIFCKQPSSGMNQNNLLNNNNIFKSKQPNFTNSKNSVQQYVQ
jgi:hypothetical protein